MAVLARRASDVRITEVDLSSTLSNSSNATAAISLVSSRGPVGPKFYSTPEDFLFDYGNPNVAVSFDHYCVLDYFKEGNSLWATRALGASYLYSAGVVKLDVALATVVSTLTGVPDPATPSWATYVIAGEVPLFLFTDSRGPSSSGNAISIAIESDNLNAPVGLTGTSATTGGTLIAGTYSYVVSALGKAGETLASAPVTVVIGGVATTNVVNLSWTAISNATGYKIYGRSGPTASLGLVATIGAGSAAYSDLGIVVPNGALNPILLPSGLPVPATTFRVKVYDTGVSTSTPVETFNCSTIDQVDETGAQMETTQRINPFSRYVRVASNIPALASVPTIRSATIAALGGGTAGVAPTTADVNTGWDRFTSKEAYRIDMLINSGRTAVSVQQKMDALATTRSDCVAYLDVPSISQTAQSAVDYRNLTLNLNSSYSTLLTSDLLESDPVTGKFLYVPPSGAVAALQARLTRSRQPWFSTAGLNNGLLRVLNVRNIYDDGAATLLYNSQLSYVRKFVGKGIALWEQNTLYQNNSALQFLNVRVLCNVLKRSMYDFLLYGLQEPGDDILRKQLQFGLEDYLRTVKAGRGISDFKVIIDDSNNLGEFWHSRRNRCNYSYPCR
jgi:Phage tail sheath protein subtilisin-like domain